MFFKNKYYCLVAGLPDLFFNENKQVKNSLEFREELKQHLHISDFELVKILFLKYDNSNFLNLLFENNEPFDERGNLTKQVLENYISHPELIPEYLVRFSKWLKLQDPCELNLQTRNKLQTFFYEYVLETKNQFLKDWLSFELNIKNIFAAFNCGQYKYSPDHQLIKTKQGDLIYSLLIGRKFKPEHYEEKLPFAEQIFRVAESGSNPEEKEKAIDKIMWNYLDEYTFFHFFTIEKILTHVIKLEKIERWIHLDEKTGRAFLNQLTEELKLSFTFPVEFSTVK